MKISEHFIFLPLLVLKVAGVMKDSTRSHQLCSSYGFSIIKAKFGKEEHLLCLKSRPLGASALASHHSALLVDPNPDAELNSVQAMPIDTVTMAYGFPVGDPSSGSAEGYIGDDHQFYGVLHIENRTLHADPYGKDDLKKFFGVFENDNMPAPRMRRDYTQPNTTLGLIEQPHFPYHIEERQRLVGGARARICDLLLLADKEFFEKDAHASLNHVVRRMMHAVAQADIIFRNSDFNEDGLPDNIGFSVKYILVLTSNETNTRVFGDLMANEKPIDGREFLMKFARLRRLSEVCLGVAFSGHAFLNRTLGLSFTSLGGGMGGAAGGLCDRRAYGRSFNTLAIAHATTETKDRVPERIAALTLAHEMGHSFGAHHDDNFPNRECHGHLMGAQSSTADSSIEFSLCSKRLIAATLSSMSYCLTEEDRPYCGNGIVEEGEACDCGLPSRCSHRDPCCTPRAGGAMVFEEGRLKAWRSEEMKKPVNEEIVIDNSITLTLHLEGCSVAPSAMCHPSQGLCCLQNCQYANLLNSGIDCKSQDQECTCTNNTCRCGLGGRCLADGSCHAAECALLGLRECQCLKSPGGILGDSQMCGICCLLNRTDDVGLSCVGAEQAALETLVNSSKLPDGWPGDDYRGPNVTIRLCKDGNCEKVAMRAWRGEEACVTLGSVGICSPRGVCTRMVHTPRSNIYPDVMHVRLQGKFGDRKSSSEPAPCIFSLSFITLLCSQIIVQWE